MVKTGFFPRQVASPTEPAFLSGACAYYGFGYLRTWLGGIKERTPKIVGQNYDGAYKSLEERLNSGRMDFETYTLGEEVHEDFVLLDDRIIYAKNSRGIRARVLQAIEDYLRPYLQYGLVIEFGSGTGRNLLWLKRRHPQVPMMGLELSIKGVELSRMAAKRFALDVEFQQMDVCASNPTLRDGMAAAVYSVHALEMMPRIFTGAVDNMLRVSSGLVLFLEPVAELYPYNPRGIISRLRIIQMDRLQGLTSYLNKIHCRITSAQRLKSAANPLNETCIIVLNG
jgi:hypothetical protein